MKFKKGDVVKIKKGVKVEELGVDIEGWHGRIGVSDYDDPEWILIELDSLVLKSLPESYIIKTLRGTDINTFHHFN